MATFREPDSLAALLMREQIRLLDCLRKFADGGGSAELGEARRILRALADAETQVLYPAFRRVLLRLETQCLLDDTAGDRGEQLAALEALARKRAGRSRKLSAVALADILQLHTKQQIEVLLPVLGSQLPRLMYRAIVHAFSARFEGALEHRPRARDTRHQRALASNA